jgi:hypothetical protein
VRLYSRPGNDLTQRFPLIVEALVGLHSHSCILDGEAVACDDKGMPCFDRLRRRRHDEAVFLYAFDLIELNGDDLRREPLEVRKATLASVLAKAAPGLRLNEHIEADGPTVFAHDWKMGLEGIVRAGCSGTVSGWRGHQRAGDRRLFGQPLPRLHSADFARERFKIDIGVDDGLLLGVDQIQPKLVADAVDV